MITSIKNKKEKRIEIDLTGPDGNVFSLLSLGIDISKKLNERRGAEYIDVEDFKESILTAENYEVVLDIMEKQFGDFIIMYR
jgi:hypothetical protein